MYNPAVGDEVKADYYGQLVHGVVRSKRIHDGYKEHVFYLDLLTPRLDFVGNPIDTVMVRASQLLKEENVAV